MSPTFIPGNIPRAEAARELSRSCWLEGHGAWQGLWQCPSPSCPPGGANTPIPAAQALSVTQLPPGWVRQRWCLGAQSIPRPQAAPIGSCCGCDCQGMQVLHCSGTISTRECLHRTQCHLFVP